MLNDLESLGSSPTAPFCVSNFYFLITNTTELIETPNTNSIAGQYTTTKTEQKKRKQDDQKNKKNKKKMIAPKVLRLSLIMALVLALITVAAARPTDATTTAEERGIRTGGSRPAPFYPYPHSPSSSGSMQPGENCTNSSTNHNTTGHRHHNGHHGAGNSSSHHLNATAPPTPTATASASGGVGIGFIGHQIN